MLAQQTNEALGEIDRIERQLDDVPPAVAKRLHSATQKVRTVGLAFQDDSLAALENALSIASDSGASQDDHVIATLCRFGYWQLGKLEAFHALRRERGLSVLEVYTRGREHEDLYQLAEALTEWDEAVGVWRFRHFKVVARIIGEDVVGTQGTPVELLAGLIKHKMFPELWAVRTELTELARKSD